MQEERDNYRWTIDAAELGPVTLDLSLMLIFVMNGTHIAPPFNALSVPHTAETLRTEQAELILTLCMDLMEVLSKQGLQM